MLIKKVSPSPVIAPATEVAWAAGFWDGEGSFLWDRRSCLPSLQVSQAGDEAVALLERVVRALGVSGSIYEGWRKTEAHKPAFKLHVRSHDAVKAFETARPFLSQTKIAQAEEAIQRWLDRKAAYVHPSAAKTHCRRGHEYTEDNTRRNSKGARVCITCRREDGRAAYHRQQAARTEVQQRDAEERRAQEDLPGDVVERILARTDVSRGEPAPSDPS